MVLLRRFSVGALATAAAALMVVGTLQHSERRLPPRLAVHPAQSGGSITSGSIHVPTRSMPDQATIDPATPRTPPHSRATLSRTPSRHPAGSAVPRSPYPAEKQQ
ncbi:hypothetical protein ACPOL_1555 [Acidisarcina polymorpha]|uniref:Uncharacterized protein n=2 Tax=Acidisarcina polymorpha TaxID=2211140 RepID=A0A2Z5FVM5_9BACT|nr:hypothetical protein ACPOL_1555 [Acidisarcina polymorpha]